MNEQICGACYRRIPGTARVCPDCGADLEVLAARAYPDKLLAALHHPLAEVRLRAILALGVRGQTDAAEALVDCALRHPLDVTAGLAIVRVFEQWGAAGHAARKRLAASHPAQIIRKAAKRV